MKHRVNVTGILLASGQMAYYGEVVDDNQLVTPETSIKDGFTVDNDAYQKEKAAKEEQAKDLEAAASDLLDKAKGKVKGSDTPPVE